jgi:predicted RNase H-like HicB family nuclease
MRPIDRYHKWVEWSDEDEAYVGKCPDLVTGIHGNDAQQVYRELCEVVEEVIARLTSEGRPLPPPTVRPMQEVG